MGRVSIWGYVGRMAARPHGSKATVAAAARPDPLFWAQPNVPAGGPPEARFSMLTPSHPSAPPSLLTDLYEITMAQGYWKMGMDRHEAVFHLFFRKNPFNGQFTIACGLAQAIEFLEGFRFDESDCEYLTTLTGNDGQPLFEPQFLDYLRRLELACDVDAIPEGTLVFPQEPLVRVKGPLIQAQIIETALLTIINFQSLIATKAARVCMAAEGDSVLEFGLRRAQGPDGGVSASRASYVGGCSGTSNVLAGKLFSIPVRGTHAHSWVMSFPTEADSFDAYAQTMPNNCIFLVDTYQTAEGVKRAIEAGKKLAAAGHKMVGIRLDSGDLAPLSRDARRTLDEAGFHDALIVGSGDLDEYRITDLKKRGSRVAVWGVGTRLSTAHDDPALGGVYKLSAIREPGGEWKHKLKVSDEPAKGSTPGVLQVRRFSRDGQYVADAIYDESTPPGGDWKLHDPENPTEPTIFPADYPSEDALVPVCRAGRCVYDAVPIEAARRRTIEELERLDESVKRLKEPEPYPVRLEAGLFALKRGLQEQTALDRD